MSFHLQVSRMAVVRNKQASSVISVIQQADKLLKILSCRSFTDHYPLSCPYLLYCFCTLTALMVRHCSRCNVCRKLLSCKSRRMSVNNCVFFACSCQLFYNFPVTCNNSRIIHHLSKSEHSFIIKVLFNIFVVYSVPCLIKLCCRHT